MSMVQTRFGPDTGRNSGERLIKNEKKISRPYQCNMELCNRIIGFEKFKDGI